MKHLIGIIGLLALTSCQNNSNPEEVIFKTIQIKSIGEAETLPDMATFQISLDCLDKSIKTAKKCLIDKSNELDNLLQSLGIYKDDILTTSVTLNRSYTWKNNSSVFEGFRSSATLYVTIRDIDKLDIIYTELLENRNLELSGLSYSHTKLDSLKNEAYLNALEKANNLADRLLEKLPESKKEILKIGNVELSASIPTENELMYMSDFDMKENEVSLEKNIAISKGTVYISATLYVEYQIK